MEKLVALDFEGVVYSGDTQCDGVNDFITSLKAHGYKIVILSNTTRLSPQELAARLQSFDVEIIDGFSLAAANLKNEKLFVLGSEHLVQKLQTDNKVLTPDDHDSTCPIEDVPLDDEVTAVVFADYKAYDFRRVALATRYVIEKRTKFFCIGKDRGFPFGASLIPGAWMLATPVSTASFRQPTVIGKPDLESVKRCIDFSQWKEVWIVGDNLETDIALANAAGVKSVLVTTGISSESDVANSEWKPTAVVTSLAQACKVIIG